MNTATNAAMSLSATLYRMVRYGFIGCVLAGFILFSSGCGGSSASGGSMLRPNPMPPSEPPPSFVSGSSQPESKKNISEASGNAPKRGSVTQSSNASRGVTTDSVSAGVSYDSGNGRPVFNVVKTGGRGFSIDSSSNEVMIRPIQDPRINGVEMLSRERQGYIYVGIQTDHSGQQQTDTDYLAAGFWAFFPDDENRVSDFEIGVFVDGGDPFAQQSLAGLTGTAIYRGEATGIYSLPGGPEAGNYLFDASVNLTADFGDDADFGTISGRISNVIDEDGSRVPGNPQVMLESADIENSPGGFFSGDTSMNHGGVSYEGKWGGQFFGNSHPTGEPGSAAGTFGVNADDGTSILGFFMAHHE